MLVPRTCRGATELLGNVLVIAGLICFVVSELTNYWQQSSAGHAGLWSVCRKALPNANCSDIGWDLTNPDDQLVIVARIMHLVGAGVVAISLICGAISAGCNLRRDACSSVQGGLYIGAGVMVAAATAVYGASTFGTAAFTDGSLKGLTTLINTIDPADFGYSMWLSWASAGCFVISGVAMVFIPCCCAFRDEESSD